VIAHVVPALLFRAFLFRHWFVHPGWFVGFGILVWLIQAALIIGVVVLFVLLLRRDRHVPTPGPPRPPSLGILEERYARGEISREEFIERRQVLTGWGPDDSTTPMPPTSSPS
jgi:putative membrane protein